MPSYAYRCLCPVYTKDQEYQRSAELFAQLCGEGPDGPYYALALLLDSQYDRADFQKVLSYLTPKRTEPTQ